MRRRIVMGLVLATACSMGPRYRPETVIAPSAHVGASPMSDSSRRFFDSLAVARARDSLAVNEYVVPRPRVDAASAASASWLDILHDSTLVALIDQALQQNRDIQAAVARINEFRADVGVARAAGPEHQPQRHRELESGGVGRLSAGGVSRGTLHG